MIKIKISEYNKTFIYVFIRFVTGELILSYTTSFYYSILYYIFQYNPDVISNHVILQLIKKGKIK